MPFVHVTSSARHGAEQLARARRVKGSESARKKWDAGFYMFGVKFDPRNYSASRRGVERAYSLTAAIDGEGRECWVDVAKLCW
jgi:hypothetical protein